MNSKTEIIPEGSVIEEFLCKVVRPTLLRVSKDAKRQLQVTALVMQENRETCSLGLLTIGSAQAQVLHGNIRLRFREAFGGRILMHCEALFDRSESVNNCSGFSLKGVWEEGTAKRTAWTMRYSVWNWTGWL